MKSYAILHLDDKVYTGVDVINWHEDKIKRITAYFFEKENENR